MGCGQTKRHTTESAAIKDTFWFCELFLKHIFFSAQVPFNIFVLQTLFLNRFLICFFLGLFFYGTASAQNRVDSGGIQQTDSTFKKDTSVVTALYDSVVKKPAIDSLWQANFKTGFSYSKFNQQVLLHHPYFGFRSQPLVIDVSEKKFYGKEGLFYCLVVLLLIFAFFRQAFMKYFDDLFRVFFRTTLKQRQIREQLMQTPLPSLLFNFFFLVSAALYTDFLLQYFKATPVNNFWLLFLYCGAALSVIYLAKFLGLKFSGWLFNMEEATDAYIFIIFIVNKVIGVFLLPILILLAFTGGNIYIVALTVSWCGIGILLAYRFILSYNAVRNQIRVNLFHFFLYILAFEVAPLLIIYKILIFFFR